MRTLIFWLSLAMAEPAPDLYEPDLPTEPAALRTAIGEQLKEENIPGEMLGEIVEELASIVEKERGLHYQRGDITVGDNLATIAQGEAWRFLGPRETGDVIEAWGNPRPDPLPLGMVVPAGVAALAPDSWAIVVMYEEEGHIDDADAATTVFDAMLKDMQQAQKDSNPDRVAAGYDALELVGWAEPPHYDPVGKKLYWAQSLKSGDNASLNYDVRVLGREGVLALSAVSSIEALDIVKPAMEDIIQRVEFNQGSRYADFNPSTDKMAAFGIGALIAGKVAAKAGLFKILLAALLAGKKLVVAGVVAGAAALKALFGKKDVPPST